MAESVWNLFPVVFGVGLAIWLLHDLEHWAGGFFAVLVGLALAGASLLASALTAFFFSDLALWALLERPKTFFAVVAGSTVAACGALFSLGHGIRSIRNWASRKNGA